MVTKIITDVTVITMGIVVLAILFGPHIAISISLINRTCTQLTRKLKLSYDIIRRNFKTSNMHKFDRNSAIISIFSFICLHGIHFLTFSLLRIPLPSDKEMLALR